MKRISQAFVASAALALVTLSAGSASAEQPQEAACAYELCLYSGLFYTGSMEAPQHPGSSWCRATFVTVRSYENLGNRRFTLYTNGDCTGSSDEIYAGESAPVSGVVGRSLWYCPAC